MKKFKCDHCGNEKDVGHGTMISRNCLVCNIGSMVEMKDVDATITCDKVSDCVRAGRFSTCYKPGMKTCDKFKDNRNYPPLSKEDLKTVERAMKPITDLKKLIDDHWSYVEGVLKAHGFSDVEKLKIAEYHYKTAFEHGYKHRDEEL